MKSIRWITPALGLVAVCLLTVGCGTNRIKADGTADSEVQISGSEEPSKDVMANISKPYVSPMGEVPLDITPMTEQWIRYFQGRGRKYMEVYLERSTRYLPMMKNTLRENGLPEDLVYISLIESGFSPLAHSHANAVGYWQFIRATGKRYGLMVDPFIDERRDPVLSTRAAAEYFKALYNLFGSWHLAMASYNVGENRVKHAVMKYYTRDFWTLVKNRRAFPKETKHYVPKFIAAALIARNPEKYGFTNIAFQPPLAFDAVALTNPISMSKLATAMNVEVETLKLLNPKFRGDYVPQYRGNETMIRVPVGTAAIATASIVGAYSPQPKIIAADYYYYRVRSGDSLSTIARKHRTSIATVRRLNNLGNRTLLRVGQKLRVPDRGGSFVSYEMPAEGAIVATAEATTPTEQPTNLGPTVPVNETAPEANTNGEAEVTTTVHVVRRGENLTLIAKKYGLSVAELRRLNKLNNRAVLRAGQTLRLRDEEISPSAKTGAFQNRRKLKLKSSGASRMVAEAKVKKKHVVRRGETLAQIADRYRVSVGAIAKRNQIKNRSRVLAGSELVIPR